MKRKSKKQNEIFSEVINSLQKQIKKLGKLSPMLHKKEKELNEFQKTLDNHVDDRTSAERIVHRQLKREMARRKELEQEVEDALEYANGIINTVRDPLIVLDVDLKVVSASPSFYQIFKVKAEDTVKQHIYELGNHQWDIPKLRELLENILPHVTSFDNFEVEHNFPHIGMRTMLLNARKINSKDDRQKQLILLAIEDITKRKEAEEKLKTMAGHDELTGCANFRSIMEILEKELARSKRYQKEFAIIMLDIDHFKRINDDYGHLAGNDVLVFFANVLKNSVRNVDVVGRYGGDEFIIILTESDSQHTSGILERIRNNLSQAKITSPHIKNTQKFTLKSSAGIATFPHDAKDVKELILFADKALLQAK